MAVTSLDDFTSEFLVVAAEYKMHNANNFLSAVRTDFGEYNESFRQVSTDIDNIRPKIPDEFKKYPLSYFILYHFARFYLDGLGYRIAISQSFRQVEGIDKVTLVSGKRTLETIPTNENHRIMMRKDYEELVEIFHELARAVVGTDVNLENLTQQFVD